MVYDVYKEALIDLCWQMGHRRSEGKHLVLSSNATSAFEDAMELVFGSDPYHLSDEESEKYNCDFMDCYEWGMSSGYFHLDEDASYGTMYLHYCSSLKHPLAEPVMPKMKAVERESKRCPKCRLLTGHLSNCEVWLAKNEIR